eukprot:Skav225960  [mRNA]  locus=scaffold6030:92380:95743:- [translate_table: standard]
MATPRKRTNELEHKVRFSAREALFRFSRFSKAYRCRLLSGIQDVQNFCLHECGGLQLKTLLTHPHVADRALAKYVVSRNLDDRKATLSIVKHGLLGCQHLMPTLRGRLATAWENLRVWEEKRTTKLRPPLPVPIWAFMIGLARGHASVSTAAKQKREWEMVALFIELGLLCLLRPGELLRLKGSDFALPGEFSLSQNHAAVRIISPKNRRQFGDEQFVTLKNPNTIAWLRSTGLMGQDALLWTATSSRFSKLFKRLTAELGLSSCNFTPGSLRPGGATMLYGQGWSIPQLRFAGRWTAEKSLEHYIQQAMATQILNRLDKAVVDRLCRLGPMCLRMILHASHNPRLFFLPKITKGSGQSVQQWKTSRSWIRRGRDLDSSELAGEVTWSPPTVTRPKRGSHGGATVATGLALVGWQVNGCGE